MSYIKDRIASQCANDPEYRALYEADLREEELRVAFMKGLAERRRRQHLTQESMAKCLGVSQARISQIERGAQPVGMDGLIAYLKAMNVNLVPMSNDEVKELGLQDRALLPAQESDSRAPYISLSFLERQTKPGNAVFRPPSGPRPLGRRTYLPHLGSAKRRTRRLG
ncbi:hypothetical protein BH11ARM2_BH11ARM2_09110 [soil metagenome]